MNAKTPGMLALLTLLIGLPALVACDRRTPEDEPPADTAMTRPADTSGTEAAPGAPTGEPAPDAQDFATPGQPPAGATTGAMSQGEALAMLMVINEHEIAAADQALAKEVAGKVREYANLMRSDHNRNMEDTRKLGGTASTSTEVTTQRSKGETALRALDAQTGKAYEKAYIDAMVQDHGEALTMIDEKLLPAATDATVREHLTATRTTVAGHLDRAKQLQTELSR